MVAVVENLHEPTRIDGVGDEVNEEGVGVDTDAVSELGALDNNETDEAGTKTGDDNNEGETTMGDDTELDERELILGVLSSDDLANEMSGVGVSPEVSVKICLGTDSTSGGTSSTTIGVETVVGVEGATLGGGGGSDLGLESNDSVSATDGGKGNPAA